MGNQTSVRVVEFVERALVPLLLGFLVFTNQQAQVRIARSQTTLAEQQAKMSAEQSKQNFNIECIKLFFNDIYGNDRGRQKMAITTLHLINDSLAIPLSRTVAEDTTYSPSVRASADAVRAGINARWHKPLSGYKVVIYYLSGDSTHSTDALAYRDAVTTLTAAGVDIRAVSKDFFTSHDYSDGYQIRYERDTETEAADSLKTILKTVHASDSLQLKTIIGRTPGSISVFVASRRDIDAAGVPAGK
jgi:hypothetical protein